MSTYVICGTIKGIKYNSLGKIDVYYFAPDQEFVVKTNYVKNHCAVLLPIDEEESTFSFKLDESECLELKNIPQYNFLRVNGHYILELINDDSIPDSDKNITNCSKKFKLVSITEIP